MARTENQNGRKYVSGGSDLRDAKPLLQAILLGMVLAVTLVAAATMANSEADQGDALQNIVIERASSGDNTKVSPHGP